MCCALSLLSISLASAGNVCCAKPNHAFFRCQHLVAIFFRARRRRGRLAFAVRAARGAAMRCCIRGRSVRVASKPLFFRHFFSAARACRRVRGFTGCIRGTRHGCRGTPEPARKYFSGRGGFPARAGPIARICANATTRGATASSASASPVQRAARARTWSADATTTTAGPVRKPRGAAMMRCIIALAVAMATAADAGNNC